MKYLVNAPLKSLTKFTSNRMFSYRIKLNNFKNNYMLIYSGKDIYIIQNIHGLIFIYVDVEDIRIRKDITLIID